MPLRIKWLSVILLVFAVVAGAVIIGAGVDPRRVDPVTPDPLMADTATPRPAAVIGPTATLAPPLVVTGSPTPGPTTAPATRPPKASPEPAFPPDLSIDRTRYTIEAAIDFNARSLQVGQLIEYLNTSGEPLEAIELVVEPNRTAGAFRLRRVAGGPAGRPFDYTLEGGRLTVQLPGALPPGRGAALYLDYDLAVPARSAPFGFDGRQLNLGDWYPRIPPFEAGTGWLIYEPSNVGEHLVYDTADFVVSLEILDGRPDLVIAAAGAGSETDFSRPITHLAARNFSLSISPDFQIASRRVGETEVNSYFFEADRRAGEAALVVVANALELFSERFGPYPHDFLAVVEAGLADGLEYDGLFFLDAGLYQNYRGTPEGYLTAIAVHETAHQWWYGLVGSNQALHPWLDEAPATYSELLYYEAFAPEAVNWWWGTRVWRYPSLDPLDSTIYDSFEFQTYVNAVYLRGARFFHDVRGLLGNRGFDKFMGDYLAAGRGGINDPDAFFDTLYERVDRGAVDALRVRYFRGAGD